MSNFAFLAAEFPTVHEAAIGRAARHHESLFCNAALAPPSPLHRMAKASRDATVTT
jgi:hypothetical protein